MTGREQLAQRIADGLRILGAQDAYVQGLVRASYAEDSLPWSSHPTIQAEFDRGFSEGRDILRVYPVQAPEAVQA